MMGIGIQLEDDADFLDVAPDTSIELTINNPIFSSPETLSPGSYSLPFALPAGKASPKNAAKLKHPDVIENNEAYQIQKASLFLRGVKFKSGTIKAASSDVNISANFLFGLSQIDPKFKTARLRDVMDENVIIDDSDITKKIFLKKIIGGDWQVTINGTDFSAADLNDMVVAINAAAHDSNHSGSYVAYARIELFANTPNGVAPPYIVLTPSKIEDDGIVALVIDSVDPLTPLSCKVADDQVANYAIESFNMTAYITPFQTFLADYLSGDFPSDKYRFPVLFNAGLYESDQPCKKESEIINGVTAGGLILNNWHTIKNYNSIQPCVLLKYVLDKIADFFSFQWEGDFYTDPEVANILIEHSSTLDAPLDYIGNSKYVFWKRSFNISSLVPDVSVVDFLKGIVSRYNLACYINETTRKPRLKYLEDVAKSIAYNEVTGFASPKKFIDDQRVTGFTLLCAKDDSDLFSQTESLVIGTSQTKIDITCGRLWQISKSSNGLMQGPRVSRKNNYQKFQLRVFHFLGMVNNGSFSYQAADISGAAFNESLADTESPGLYSRFFKYWLLFRKNWRLVKVDVRWPLRLLLRFDYEKKIRFDRSNYILSSMKVKITNRGVQSVEAQLLTMK